MKRISTSLCVLTLLLCSRASLKAQNLVGDFGGSFPFGCVTIFTGVPGVAQFQGPVAPFTAPDGDGGVVVIPQNAFTFVPNVDELACADGISVDIGGVLKIAKNTGGIHFPDGTTLNSASQLTAPSGSQLWSSFAIAFLAKYTISTFTPDNNIVITRLQAQLPIAPSRCSSNAVVSVSNGTSTANLTLSSLANDSGPISFNFSSATPITLSVTTPAECWGGIPPAASNILVQYKVTQ